MEITPTTERVAARPAAHPLLDAPALGLLLVVAAALLPRLLGLADFLTTDEAYHWITRSERFAAAVAEGRWADTILTGHPGVTLMWLGGLGLRLEQAAVALGLAAPPDRLGHLAWMRVGPALAQGAAVGAGYLLLRRLLRPEVALLGALLWATSPYLVAHGRLLHLDGLLTSLCTLTLLAALLACRAARPLPWLALSGALAGLSLLTKGPALILLPFVGLTLFGFALARYVRTPPRPEGRGAGGGGTLRPEGRGAGGRSTLRPEGRGAGGGDTLRPAGPGAGGRSTLRPYGILLWPLIFSLRSYLLWLAVAALTVLLLWPALWAAPGAALGRYVGEIIGNGGRPNGDGQFFLGQAVGDPGPLFYLVAGAFRLTALESLGLLLAGGLGLAGGWRLARARRAPSAEAAALLTLAAFALFWTLVMTLGPKKFDRYTLPTWPALMVLSAAGLAAGWDRAAAMRSTANALRPAAFLLCLLFQAATLAWYHPYYLSYYSPLLGGGRAAQGALLIGWGEGMDQAGEWLRARPDIGHGQILSALPPTLQPFVPVPVQEVRAIDSVPANYAVVYLESLQRGDAPEVYARIGATAPVHSVTIHGVEYARIYQLPRPYETAVDAQFGAGMGLRGYSLAEEGGRLVVTPAWDVRAAPAADYMLFLHLYDAAGARVAQIDVPPGGASAPPTSQWRPGEQIAVPLPIDLPPGLAPGSYTLALGLYDPASGARAPLSAGPPMNPAVAGPDALRMGEFRKEN